MEWLDCDIGMTFFIFSDFDITGLIIKCDDNNATLKKSIINDKKFICETKSDFVRTIEVSSSTKWKNGFYNGYINIFDLDCDLFSIEYIPMDISIKLGFNNPKDKFDVSLTFQKTKFEFINVDDIEFGISKTEFFVDSRNYANWKKYLFLQSLFIIVLILGLALFCGFVLDLIWLFVTCGIVIVISILITDFKKINIIQRYQSKQNN